jgi:hypothetical protein
MDCGAAGEVVQMDRDGSGCGGKATLIQSVPINDLFFILYSKA